MKLVMTLLVRDAEGILRENLEFHLRQGVDFFIVTDNRSVDRTAEIVADFVKAGRAELIREDGDDYSQWRWVTRMARRAATLHGADWVINNDDDEFWFGRSSSLKEALAQVPETSDGLIVERCNHPPVAGGDGRAFLETMIYRERHSRNALGQPLPPKVCHRGLADVDVAQGNHGASRAGVALDLHPGSQLGISHYPVRDFASFECKIVNGGAAYARNQELAPTVGLTWRRLYALWLEGGLRRWYEEQLLTPARIAAGLGDGSLVQDDAVLRALSAGRTA